MYKRPPENIPEYANPIEIHLMMLKRLISYPSVDIPIPFLNKITVKDYKEKIESKFQEGMNWENFERLGSGWTISYINTVPPGETHEDYNELLNPDNIQLIRIS